MERKNLLASQTNWQHNAIFLFLEANMVASDSKFSKISEQQGILLYQIHIASKIYLMAHVL